MLVQAASSLYFNPAIARSASTQRAQTGSTANIADPVSISQAGRDAFAAAANSVGQSDNDQSVAARLAEIKAAGPINRSPEDQEYLFKNDKRLAAIAAQGKSADELSADDLDYMQKATGLVNTFANLSAEEKALYNKAVASGNKAAAEGISQIAMVRMMGHTAGGANGTTYDPLATEIKAANIEKYFRFSIVDPSGNADAKFQALANFLNSNKVA